MKRSFRIINHVERNHSLKEEDKKVMCNLCGKVNANQAKLIRHNVIHTKLKHVTISSNILYTFIYGLNSYLPAQQFHLADAHSQPIVSLHKKPLGAFWEALLSLWIQLEAEYICPSFEEIEIILLLSTIEEVRGRALGYGDSFMAWSESDESTKLGRNPL
ncbi:unnamed protein product [Orchesella dallaii]|uniref:C2H2-type domain-containing protein n=1 Tax=Orchesella dallaii TaxID=48710 RepID=A0ABP1RHG7_9HEXA